MKSTIIVRGEPRRFRYILCGLVDFDGPISDYRLIGGNNLGDAASCIRFKLPELFHMEKYSCDSYSTTDDKRTLNQIGYDVLVKINGRWVVRNDLKGTQPHKIYHVMSKNGYSPVPKLGYVNARQHKFWSERRDARIRKAPESNTLPPEYADKYAIVWHNDDGTLDYALDDAEFTANRCLKVMQKIDSNAYIIKPVSQKGE